MTSQSHTWFSAMRTTPPWSRLMSLPVLAFWWSSGMPPALQTLTQIATTYWLYFLWWLITIIPHHFHFVSLLFHIWIWFPRLWLTYYGYYLFCAGAELGSCSTHLWPPSLQPQWLNRSLCSRWIDPWWSCTAHVQWLCIWCSSSFWEWPALSGNSWPLSWHYCWMVSHCKLLLGVSLLTTTLG